MLTIGHGWQRRARSSGSALANKGHAIRTEPNREQSTAIVQVRHADLVPLDGLATKARGDPFLELPRTIHAEERDVQCRTWQLIHEPPLNLPKLELVWQVCVVSSCRTAVAIANCGLHGTHTTIVLA